MTTSTQVQPPVAASSQEKYPAIADHGLIGDLQTAALVDTRGVIDWFCSPRFDSPSIFASLLDRDRGGHFRIGSAAEAVTKQLYFPSSAVLITRFMAEEGVGEVLDFMPIDHPEAASDRLGVLVTGGTPLPPLSMAERIDRAERLLRGGVPKTAGDEAERIADEARDAGIVVRALRVEYPHIPIILMTAQGSVEAAVEAVAAGASDFIGEPPAQRAEDRQGDGNENDMNAKDFANKERRTLEIRFPLHDANQKQIQNCDRELRDSSCAQGKIEDRIVYEEVVHGFGYIFTSASQRLGNSNSKFSSRNRFGTQR